MAARKQRRRVANINFNFQVFFATFKLQSLGQKYTLCHNFLFYFIIYRGSIESKEHQQSFGYNFRDVSNKYFFSQRIGTRDLFLFGTIPQSPKRQNMLDLSKIPLKQLSKRWAPLISRDFFTVMVSN